MKSKIAFRLYQIDMGLPDEIIEGYLSLETTDDIDPKVYRLVWDSQEDPDLDKLYSKYTKDDRPNKHVCRCIDVSDVVEIVDEQGITFFIADNFGWTEIEFDKSEVPPEMGFENWIVNMDFERRRNLSMDINAKAAMEILVQRLGKSKKTVTAMCSKSRTFVRLFDHKTGLWALSPYSIVEAFEKELKEE